MREEENEKGEDTGYSMKKRERKKRGRGNERGIEK